MVNRYQQKFGMDAVKRRLQGSVDPRGMAGILSRGSNIYQGVSNAAHSGGGPQFGRPTGAGDTNPLAAAANRRMARKNRPNRTIGGTVGGNFQVPGQLLPGPVTPTSPPVGNRFAAGNRRRMSPYG